LQAGLQRHGLTEKDIAHVFLTHIHLDHAGAAGWMARQGATIYVHPVGAPHLVNPEKLLSSAARIYGADMDRLWGEFLPVPENQLVIIQDTEVVELDGLQIRAIETPGHAYHHHAYRLGEVLFTGDIGGIRLPGPRHIRIPMPPPEFHLEQWRSSIRRLMQEDVARIAPTHFGIYGDPAWHLAAVRLALDEVEAWMAEVLPPDPPLEEINRQFLAWSERRSLGQGVPTEVIQAYEAANPSWMSPLGMQRYWRKHRQPSLP
jgi:glyoxylase-like metal-dependent hydrolase (beta-lactamase superfamily II)